MEGKKQIKISLTTAIILIVVLLVLVVGFVLFLNGDKKEIGTENNNDTKTTTTSIAEAKKTGYSSNDNTILTDEYGNTVVLPAGFKIASDSEDVVTKGIVIEDITETATKGSQFVWIPVTKQDGTKIKTSKTDNEGIDIVLDRYIWNNNTLTAVGDMYIEFDGYNFTEDLKTESGNGKGGNAIANDIMDFCTKVKASGGYYIGRYEASNNSETIAIKANQTAYTNITQQNAAAKCKNMYVEKTFTSDLMNSYAWDTALKFIQVCGNDGNYPNLNLSTAFAKTGNNGDEVLKINDMSGNAWEWTTETFGLADYPCVARGGFYGADINKVYFNAIKRTPFTYYANDFGSFRPILYL